MCIKHEHKEHQVITYRIGDKDKEDINSNTELLVVKPIAEDQSKSDGETVQKLMLSFGHILERMPVTFMPNSPHQT